MYEFTQLQHALNDYAERLVAAGDLDAFQEVFGTDNIELDMKTLDLETQQYIYCEYIGDGQPLWKYIDNFGDASPIDYGGRFLFVDESGKYDPEVAVLEPINEHEWEDVEHDDETTDVEGNWELSRYVLEKCYYTDGVLSDNKFHKNHPAWFADSLESIAKCCDNTVDALIEGLCSDDPIERMEAYRDIDSYHGVYEFDQYPVSFELQSEVERWLKDRGIKD